MMRLRRWIWWTMIVSIAVLTGVPLRVGAQPEKKPKVIVVGGGLAGLVTAYELNKKDVSCVVLDAGDRLGGRIATAEYTNGLHAEYGMQEVWEKNPLLGIIKELGLTTEATDDAWSSLIIDGHLYPFVQDTREKYFHVLFTPAERKVFDRTLAEMEDLYREATTKGLTPRMRELQTLSFADWLAQRKLPNKVEQALRLTIEVELAAVSEQFSALSAILEWRVFLFGGEKNYHVAGGNSKIIEALAGRSHAQVVLNALVVAVKHQPRPDGSVDCEVTYQVGREYHKIHGDAVVVAIPWVRLHGIQFDPPFEPARWKAVDSLGRGQYTVVHFIVDKAVEGLWKATGSPFPILSSGPLGVIYGPHGQGNDKGDIVFSLLIYGPEAQAYHMKPRDVKRVETLAELDKLWPGFSSYVKETYVYGYHPAAVAYWPPGRSPLDELSNLMRTPSSGLFLAGDWLYSSHSEGAAIAGLETAKKVAAFLHR